jgi:hypothetical protein
MSAMFTKEWKTECASVLNRQAAVNQPHLCILRKMFGASRPGELAAATALNFRRTP